MEVMTMMIMMTTEKEPGQWMMDGRVCDKAAGDETNP